MIGFCLHVFSLFVLIWNEKNNSNSFLKNILLPYKLRYWFLTFLPEAWTKSKDTVIFLQIPIDNELLLFFLHLPLHLNPTNWCWIFFLVERKKGHYNEWIKCSSSDFFSFFSWKVMVFEMREVFSALEHSEHFYAMVNTKLSITKIKRIFNMQAQIFIAYFPSVYIYQQCFLKTWCGIDLYRTFGEHPCLLWKKKRVFESKNHMDLKSAHQSIIILKALRS